MPDLPVVPIDRPAALDGQENGRLDPSIRTTVGLVTLLTATSMRCWQAMVAAAVDDGITLAPEGSAGTYRTYAQQVQLFTTRYQPNQVPGVTTATFKRWDGGDGGPEVRWYLKIDPDTGDPYATAAVPGDSNHGLALAVDVVDAAGTRLEWLKAHALTYGFSWEPGINYEDERGEPWHIRVVCGDNIPQPVLDYEQGEPVTDEDVQKVATAVWAKIIGSPALGDKAASEFLKQGQLAKQEATAAKDATAAQADDITQMKADIAEIKGLLQPRGGGGNAGGGSPGAPPAA